VLTYLSLYTHRIAISNSRLVTFDDTSVTFRWKDYRANGRDRAKVMTLAIDEFIRRFLIHLLPGGFHRIRHYGLFANGGRADNIAPRHDRGHRRGTTTPEVRPDEDKATSFSAARPSVSPFWLSAGRLRSNFVAARLAETENCSQPNVNPGDVGSIPLPC
jgi:hypothetical protein